MARGYRIEAVNWRKSRYEIDIVAAKGDVLAFVEVKTSKDASLGPPELRVDRTKQKRIAEAASEYLAELEEIPENIRFDVIRILWGQDKRPEITHLEAAYVIEEDI